MRVRELGTMLGMLLCDFLLLSPCTTVEVVCKLCVRCNDDCQSTYCSVRQCGNTSYSLLLTRNTGKSLSTHKYMTSHLGK